jgi:hypothetical protein
MASGEVIRIGGVSLEFIEESPEQRRKTDTQHDLIPAEPQRRASAVSEAVVLLGLRIGPPSCFSSFPHAVHAALARLSHHHPGDQSAATSRAAGWSSWLRKPMIFRPTQNSR